MMAISLPPTSSPLVVSLLLVSSLLLSVFKDLSFFRCFSLFFTFYSSFFFPFLSSIAIKNCCHDSLDDKASHSSGEKDRTRQYAPLINDTSIVLRQFSVCFICFGFIVVGYVVVAVNTIIFIFLTVSVRGMMCVGIIVCCGVDVILRNNNF